MSTTRRLKRQQERNERKKSRLIEQWLSTPQRQITRARKALPILDERIAYLEAGSPTVACQRGCSYCCRQAVVVSAQEVLSLKRWLQDNRDPEDLKSISERVSEVDNRTHGLGIRERLDSQVACPFLVADECSVYPARPLACRTHHSLDVDPCRRGHAGENFPMRRSIRELAQLIDEPHYHRARVSGLPARPLDLTAAVAIALEREDAESAWLSGEDVFADAEQQASREDKLVQMKLLDPLAEPGDK